MIRPPAAASDAKPLGVWIEGVFHE
jgi:hypothetical protein